MRQQQKRTIRLMCMVLCVLAAWVACGHTTVLATASSASAQDNLVMEDYGTSSANIASGGFAAGANGKTFVVLRDGNGYGSDKVSCIGVISGASQTARVIYRAQNTKDYENNAISWLHVTDQGLVFAELHMRRATGTACTGEIVRTRLDGSGREVLATLSDARARIGNTGRLWVGNGLILFLDGDVLYARTVDGKSRTVTIGVQNEVTFSGNQRREVTRIDPSEIVMVNHGQVFVTSDGRTSAGFFTPSGVSENYLRQLSLQNLSIPGSMNIKISSMYFAGGQLICCLDEGFGDGKVEAVAGKWTSYSDPPNLMYASWQDDSKNRFVTSVNEVGGEAFFVTGDKARAGAMALYKSAYGNGGKVIANNRLASISDGSPESGVCVVGDAIYYKNGKGQLCSVGKDGRSPHVIAVS